MFMKEIKTIEENFYSWRTKKKEEFFEIFIHLILYESTYNVCPLEMKY